jgi:hypothetical protein
VITHQMMCASAPESTGLFLLLVVDAVTLTSYASLLTSSIVAFPAGSVCAVRVSWVPSGFLMMKVMVLSATGFPSSAVDQSS